MQEKPKEQKWLLGYYEGVSNPPPQDQDFSQITGVDSPLWRWADTSSLNHVINFDGLPYPVFDWNLDEHKALVNNCLWAIVFDYPPDEKPSGLVGDSGSEFVGKDE